jgi:hypothetical protein
LLRFFLEESARKAVVVPGAVEPEDRVETEVGTHKLKGSGVETCGWVFLSV